MSNCCGNSPGTAQGSTSGTTRRTLPEIDRITWRDGQLLTSQDMRDDAHDLEIERRLHIRYLHRTWGVVEGLNVLPFGAILRVGIGYALDIEGRELLLPAVAEVLPPPVVIAPATMYLVISHSDNARATCCDAPIDLTTLCPGMTSAHSFYAGSISWKTVREVRPGLDILLARVLISKGAIASLPDTSVQRRAASFAQSRIWSDATQSGSTGWVALNQTSTQLPLFLFLQAAVDTSDAGFVQAPTYFARAVGAPPPAAGYVTATAPASFTFVLRLPNTDLFRRNFLSDVQAITITWLAVELPPSAYFSPIPLLKGNVK